MSQERVTLEEMERETAAIGRLLKNAMPKGCGFALLLFSYGENGFINYVSSAEREDMIKSMKELIQRLENDPRQYHRTEPKR